MEAAAHNPAFAEKAGIPQKVATKFVAADKKVGKKAAGEQRLPRSVAIRMEETGNKGSETWS